VPLGSWSTLAGPVAPQSSKGFGLGLVRNGQVAGGLRHGPGEGRDRTEGPPSWLLEVAGLERKMAVMSAGGGSSGLQ
jgi:hypothetical protein